MSGEVVAVLISAPDAETARRIGRALVEERLAACVNVIPGMSSIYRWRGAVEEAAEVLLVAKTRAAARGRAGGPCPHPPSLRASGGRGAARSRRQPGLPAVGGGGISMSSERVGLPEALERAARALRREADAIRPANGDPGRLAEGLGPEASARVLAWLLANEPEAGEELAVAWADDPQGAGQALLKLEPDALPKPARKILRRVMHALRSRGVALPEAAPAERVATLPAAQDDAIDEARITPFDARGGRVVALAVSHPGGGVRLFQIAIDPARGVLDFEVLSAARRDVRRWLRESARGGACTLRCRCRRRRRARWWRARRRRIPSRARCRAASPSGARACAEAPAGTRTPGELAREALGSGSGRRPRRSRRSPAGSAATASARGRRSPPGSRRWPRRSPRRAAAWWWCRTRRAASRSRARWTQAVEELARGRVRGAERGAPGGGRVPAVAVRRRERRARRPGGGGRPARPGRAAGAAAARLRRDLARADPARGAEARGGRVPPREALTCCSPRVATGAPA